MADGTVQGTTKIQRTGEVYTFLENFAGPLFVKKDNIVIDGAGYTVTGGSGRGIVLENRTGVTLKNTKVTLEGGYVIDMRNTSNCIIEKNTLIGTPKTVSDYPSSPSLGPIAINLLHSKNITIKDNAITNFFYGLSLEWSSGHTITGNVLSDGIIGIEILNTTGCIFRNNILKNCQFSIRTYQNYTYDNDLDASNTVNGKPVCYWVNVKDKTVPNMAAYIVLTKCSNITIKNDSPKVFA
jgi:parallel beta-helix repeat protein